jgi:cysteine desulfurase/selenocysteine lyase
VNPDWSAIRAEFPALSNWAFLNTATFGQLPKRAVEAVACHWARRDELACSDFLDWYCDADRLRGAIARLIHASAEDVTFVSNASAGLGIVMAGLKLTPGEVVTLSGEFPSYLYVAGVREVQWGRFYDCIDERTRMVAIAEVNYSNGFRAPLEEISEFLRSRNVVFFVDGTQSVGALRFDVEKVRPDALVVHGYKWMISPTGAGFMYVAPDLRKRVPPNVTGWRSHKTWREVDNLHHGTPVFKETAEKYEGGGLPFPLLYAMEASVNLMLEIGPEAIERRVLELAGSARRRLLRLGAEAPESGSQIVAAKFAGAGSEIDPSRLARELKERRVLVAARHGYLRVSPHFYNNEEDLDRLEEELRALL